MRGWALGPIVACGLMQERLHERLDESRRGGDESPRHQA